MKKSYIKYLAGLLLFGSNGVIASSIHLSSYEIVLLRSVLGAALAAALLGAFFISGQAVGEGIHAGGLPDPRRRCVRGMVSGPEAVVSGRIFDGTFLCAAS